MIRQTQKNRYVRHIRSDADFANQMRMTLLVDLLTNNPSGHINKRATFTLERPAIESSNNLANFAAQLATI